MTLIVSFVVFISPPSHVTATGGMGKRLGKTLPLKVGQVQDHVLKKRNYLLVDWLLLFLANIRVNADGQWGCLLMTYRQLIQWTTFFDQIVVHSRYEEGLNDSLWRKRRSISQISACPRLLLSAGHRWGSVSRHKQEGNLGVIYKRLIMNVLVARL